MCCQESTQSVTVAALPTVTALPTLALPPFSLSLFHIRKRRPDPSLGKYGHVQETPRETLVREALEYQEIYHKDKGTPAGAKEARIKEIMAEIEASGTYTHTFDELEHGSRVAWR